MSRKKLQTARSTAAIWATLATTSCAHFMCSPSPLHWRTLRPFSQKFDRGRVLDGMYIVCPPESLFVAPSPAPRWPLPESNAKPASETLWARHPIFQPSIPNMPVTFVYGRAQCGVVAEGYATADELDHGSRRCSLVGMLRPTVHAGGLPHRPGSEVIRLFLGPLWRSTCLPPFTLLPRPL